MSDLETGLEALLPAPATLYVSMYRNVHVRNWADFCCLILLVAVFGFQLGIVQK